MNRWRVLKLYLVAGIPETDQVQICSKKNNSDA